MTAPLFQPARPQTTIATTSCRRAGISSTVFQPARPQTTIATRYSRVEAIRLAFVSTRATADIGLDVSHALFFGEWLPEFQTARPQTTIATGRQPARGR